MQKRLTKTAWFTRNTRMPNVFFTPISWQGNVVLVFWLIITIVGELLIPNMQGTNYDSGILNFIYLAFTYLLLIGVVSVTGGRDS